jgi:2-polyprenyl-3-methyl-5-hydroxy-6-metoxy-1,4-benzoquinol methylase
MRPPGESHGPDHFRRLYDRNDDPWNYHTSDYEKSKRDATIAALGNRRYRSALEVGCSIGVLTLRLAGHCDRILGVDFVDTALAVARVACDSMPHVTFRNVRIPVEWPGGHYDLIVLSEVLYFLSESDSAALAGLCKESMKPDGVLLLVNWLEESPDDPCSGDDAATRFIATSATWLEAVSQHRTDRFRIDLLTLRVPG